MKQAHCIYQDDEHRWLAIARDPSKPGPQIVGAQLRGPHYLHVQWD